MCNKNVTHGMRGNTYTFVHDKTTITLYPMKPKPPNKGSRAGATKETLQVCYVYRGNVNRSRVRGRTLFQPWKNDVVGGPYVGPK